MANHLVLESSAYLQQHANNPVDWYPWGDEALQIAKKQNKPIFVSIGYSSCHWCHVMEHESFENENIAKLLNEHFVSIKVDKEERPDIDKYFQEVYALMNGRGGGWPTSIFLTPDLKPFYSATYIPSTPKYGMMAFDELLNAIAQKYTKDPALLAQKGSEVLDFLKPKSKVEATKLDVSIIEKFIAQAKSLFDKQYGGFGNAPKFPQVSTYMALIDFYKITKDNEILQIIETSLDSMIRGGLYDRVDGGFCRYSTDERWLVPHFEKMTYDNALLAELYLRAYLLTQKYTYKEIALETIEFMRKYMSEDGLFYAASDADTNGLEGEYFIYDHREAINAFIQNGMTANDAAKIAAALDITPNGNFEGKSIINVSDPNKINEIMHYDQAITALKEIRTKREYPFRDTKIITAWNAMMIKTLFYASKIEPKYLEIAKNSISKLLDKLYINGVLYHTSINNNTPNVEAFLEDYAYLAQALIEAHQSTFEKYYLDLAIELANEAIRKFYTRHEWNFATGEFATKAETYDSSYPSSLGVMLDVLGKLDILSDLNYGDIIFASLERHSHSLMRQPISSPCMSNAVSRYLKDLIVLKSTKTNFDTNKDSIALLSYPYLLLEVSDEDGWSLCGKGACFAHTKTFEEIKLHIESLDI
ncbi:MAG: thioredoxin domain-containing protein [Sulfurovaceae bacterium]|nr:thioredoxin domain-containing protein [Sulfurovaceae bacterium]